MWHVYLTENLINGRIYIGKHKGDPFDEYLGSGSILKSAITKYGRKNFRKSVLEFAETEELVDFLEMKWIERYRQTHGSKLYNLTDGGTGGNTLKYLSPDVISKTRSGWSSKMSKDELDRLKQQRREWMRAQRADPILEERRISSLKNRIRTKSAEDRQQEYLNRSGSNNHNRKSVQTPLGRFDTLTAAAKAHNITVTTVTNRCNNPNFGDWRQDERP
jgi:group I intron endonuclease